MKALIGINPKGHIHLGTDELEGLERAGVECSAVRYGRKDFTVKGPLKRIFDAVANAFNIISRLYKFSPDILYLNSRLETVASARDFITVFLVKCFYYKRLKIAIKSHGSDIPVLVSKAFLYKWVVIPFLTRHVDLWLFLSHEEKNGIARCNPKMAERVVVTCNIIEPDRLVSNNEFKDKYHLNNDKLKVLYIGRVLYEKGVFDFLKAIPMVDRKDKCDFLLVGDGEDLARARQLAGDLGLEPYLRFLGWVDQGEAEHFYGSVDILVFPSFHGEGFPMALFKAVASGLAVVTTRIRAAIDHLKMPENVIWVQPQSEKQVADAINMLVGNDELRDYMSANNRRMAAQFSRDKVCVEMREAFMAI